MRLHHPFIKYGFVLSVIILIVIGYEVFHRSRLSQKESLPKEVTIVTLMPETFSEEISAVGTARSKDSVILTANVTETVKKIYFTDDQDVQKGDTILELNSDAENADLQAAQEALKETKQQYERSLSLFQKKVIAESRLEQDTRAYKEAQANVHKVQATLADRLIVAPFDGVLGLKNISEGALVTPGTPIVTLDDISEIKIDFDLAEKFLSQVQNGQTVFAHSDSYPTETFKAKVVSLSTQIDPVTRSFTVRAIRENEDKKLKPGMFLMLTLRGHPRETLFIPEISTLSDNDKKYVYKLTSDNKLEKTFIQSGVRTKGKIEVIKGLKKGDRIVYEGLRLLRPGEIITPHNQKETKP